MSAVVEILSFTTSGYPSREKKLDEALQLASDVDGADEGYRGFQVGKSDNGYIIQVWQSLQHHQDLLNHPNFAKMRETLSTCFSSPPVIWHMRYNPASNALKQPVLHVIRAELKDPTNQSRRALHDAVNAITDRLGENAVGGECIESPDVYFVLYGGNTVEKANANENGERAARDLSQFASVDHAIVWLKPTIHRSD